MKNQQFWGMTVIQILQTLNYTCFLICIFSYLSSERILYNFELITIVIFFLIRCHVIATKYATYTSGKMQRMKTKLLTTEDIFEDLLINWLHQGPSLVSKEIQYSCRRENFDLSFFFMSFFFPLDEAKDKKLSEHIETMRPYYDTL